MSAIFRTFFFLLLMVLQAHRAIAGTQSVTVDVGGQSVYVPAPAGFHEISRLSPETRKLAETFTPPDNRLLAVFVSESDLGRIMKGETPKAERYMFLQVYRRLENSGISGTQFSQLVGQVKQQQDTILEKAKDEVGPLVDKASGKFADDYGISLKLKIGDLVPLGFFMEKSDAAGFASFGKIQGDADGQQLDSLLVSGISYVRVKGKLLYAYVYGKYETPKDLDWVRTTSTNWVDQILAANIGQGSSTKADYRSTSASGFDWDKVFEKGITAAIAGVFIGLIGVAIVATKRLFGKKKEHDY